VVGLISIGIIPYKGCGGKAPAVQYLSNTYRRKSGVCFLSVGVSPWKEDLVGVNGRTSGDARALEMVEESSSLPLPQLELLLSR
jgi:hypothetical protein